MSERPAGQPPPGTPALPPISGVEVGVERPADLALDALHVGGASTARQTDVRDGGAGGDWIYASHGTNHIGAGSGDDHVHAYFGHVTIDCGPGVDVLTLSRTTRHAYTCINCETVRIGYP